MRELNQRRLRGNNSTRMVAPRADRPCVLCERGTFSHVHCQICRAPLEGFTRKTCPGNCKKLFKAMRREDKFVRCWVEPLNASGKKFLKWIPKRLATPPATGVATRSDGRRTIPQNGSTPKAKRLSRG